MRTWIGVQPARPRPVNLCVVQPQREPSERNTIITVRRVTDVTAQLRVTLPDPARPTVAEVERAARVGADVVAALEARGVEIPPVPQIFTWDEGYYAWGTFRSEG